MTLYNSDSAPLFEGILYHDDDVNISLPTIQLKEILKKSMNPLEFKNIQFQSPWAGRVLAQMGQNTSILLMACKFEMAAEVAFVEEMLSKMDKNVGLSKLCFLSNLPLLMSKYGPIVFSYFSPNAPYSKVVLDGLCNSPGLQSLALCSKNFADGAAADDENSYAGFLRSLNSTNRSSSSLRILILQGWNFRKVAFPVEIFQNLSLTQFSLKEPTLTETGWKNLLQEIPKCKTLVSVEFWYLDWWGSKKRDKAALEFALELAQFLKQNPNIVSTNKREYITGDDINNDNDKDDIVYTKHIGPILEHNRLIQNLKRIDETVSYGERGFLMSEAVGRQYATNLSSCYTIVKANMDVLVSYNISRQLSRGKKRSIWSLHS